MLSRSIPDGADAEVSEYFYTELYDRYQAHTYNYPTKTNGFYAGNFIQRRCLITECKTIQKKYDYEKTAVTES